MAVPVSFPSSTPNFSLPLLFSGQAQKEFFLNQSFSIIDSLLQVAVIDSISSPPVEPKEGDSFRVTAPATDAWTGQEGQLAIFIGGSWVFVPPHQGMTIYDRQAGAITHFESNWLTATEPSLPTTGSTVDAEARLMLSELVEALRNVGIFPNPPPGSGS